jgi:hypothetical protein
MKKIRWFFFLLVFLLLSFGLSWFFMPEMIRAGLIESYYQLFAVSADSGQVEMDLLAGEIAVNKFSLGNPVGFTTPNFFTLNKGSVKLENSSLLEDVVRIKSISITGTELTFEEHSGKVNLLEIQKRIKQVKQQIDDQLAGLMSTKEVEVKAGTRVIIEHLQFSEGKIRIFSPILPGGEKTVRLPAFDLRDIGKKENGRLVVDVINQLVDHLLEAALHESLSDRNLKFLEKWQNKVNKPMLKKPLKKLKNWFKKI